MNTDKKRAWYLVLLTLVVFGVFIYFNIITKRGGILDKAIMNKSDRYLQMDKKFQALSAKGIKTGDIVSFVIDFGGRLDKQDLFQVADFTDKLKAEFPDYGILSLSAAVDYQDTGYELLTDSYIEKKKIASSDFDLSKWKQNIKRDQAVYGVLVGKNFDYAQVVLFLPTDYDEVAVFRQVVSFLENRQISAWEWFIKTDIKPVFEYANVYPAGWVMGRGLTDAALTTDILKFSSIGLTLTFVFFLISFGSWRQALISIVLVNMSFLWARGSVGLSQWLNFEFYERVYFLLVFTGQIVADVSFAEHKFSTYNQIRQKFPDLSRAEIWKKARCINFAIVTTAVIAALNFLTLYQIGVRGIWEVGIFSTIGIGESLFLFMFALPATHTLFGGESLKKQNGRFAKSSFYWNKAICWLIDALANRFATPKKARSSRLLASWLLIGSFVLALALTVSDYLPWDKGFKFIEVKTKPLEYIRGTRVYRASQFLNASGRYGFDRISVLARSQTDVYDPAFVKQVAEFEKTIGEIKGIRQTTSVVDTLSRISQESFNRPLQQTRQEVYDDLQMIEADLGPKLKEQLWYEQGIVIFASAAMEDSNQLGKKCDEIMELANSQFPDLNVLAFGKVPAYPRVDKYIREGKPLNVLTSQWLVIVACVIWAYFRSWKFVRSFQLVGWKTGLVMSLPFVFGMSFIALLMIGLRIPMDQAMACITALAINAGIDFSIYLVWSFQNNLPNRYLGEEIISAMYNDKGREVLLDIILNMVCFSVLSFSSFLPISRLGWVMVVMLLACGFGALFFLPAFLPWCIRKEE